MAKRNHLDDFTRGRMIRKLEEGGSLTSLGEQIGINKSFISLTWKAFQTIGSAVRKVVADLFTKFNEVNLTVQGDSIVFFKTEAFSAFLSGIKPKKYNTGGSDVGRYCTYVHHLAAFYSDFETRSKLLQTKDYDLPSAMELLKNRKDFFKDFRSDTAFKEMLCDAREFADELNIPTHFELTQHVIEFEEGMLISTMRQEMIR
ncbi:uncharacterized protein TNCV_1439051 [Trichonephila clavipes]|nr:uncharacterized protein TNCV_1439051 [Trichonephila clavipes]